MGDDYDNGGHPPPEMEDRSNSGWRPAAAAPYSKEDAQDFRPILRPAVPVVTVLDDGSQHGEAVRLRGDTFTIGRTSGDLVLPNDQAISGMHAEILRRPWKGSFQWMLRDIRSVNGTFVRAARAVFHEEAIVILGSRRFRLRNPLVARRGASASSATLLDSTALPPTVWPVLVEATQRGQGIEVPLRSDSVSIGRTGGGADLEFDDPLVANRHAQLERQRDGTWLIVAETTRNGVWVSITEVTLKPYCHFRCGEQLFRFEIP
jgi:pSer/pThr/pTyr-binding forkhead associated (FHA) protein